MHDIKYTETDYYEIIITDETVMTHIKGELRKYILRNYDIRIMPEYLRKAAQLWRQMEAMLCVK